MPLWKPLLLRILLYCTWKRLMSLRNTEHCHGLYSHLYLLLWSILFPFCGLFLFPVCPKYTPVSHTVRSQLLSQLTCIWLVHNSKADSTANSRSLASLLATSPLWRLQVGPLATLDPASETVTAYLERFQLFVTADSIDDDKLVPTFLTVFWSSHYYLLRGLVAPKMPKELSYDELKEILKKDFDLQPILMNGLPAKSERW